LHLEGGHGEGGRVLGKVRERVRMVRSAAGHGAAQDRDAAAAALARLSSSMKPQPAIRLPAVLSVRVLLFILVVVLSLVVLIPIVSRSRNDFNAVHTLHAVPSLPRTANLHSGTNWRRYTLPQAAQVRNPKYPRRSGVNPFASSLQIFRGFEFQVKLVGFPEPMRLGFRGLLAGSGKRWRGDSLHSEPALFGVSQQLAHQRGEAGASPGSSGHRRGLRHA
jgi:hypothetical protein